jgi:DNA-binding transcriptional LysR family regulator
VPEYIPLALKRAAVVLADESDYKLAAAKLHTTSAILRKQIAELEAQLYVHIFKPRQKKVELTEEGTFLLKVFREAVAVHDRGERNSLSETEKKTDQ